MRPVKRKIWSSLSVILAKAGLLYASFVSLILQALGFTVMRAFSCAEIVISAQI